MRNFTAFMCSSFLVACASASSGFLHQQLDEQTGVTVSRMNEPMTFIVPGSASSNQAEFVYLGPLEINRMGQRSYFLWLSLVSRRIGGEPASLSEIAILADENPLDLPPPTIERAILGTQEHIYPLPAPWAKEVYFAATPALLRRMSAARELLLEVDTKPGKTTTFEPLRDNRAALREFLNSTLGNAQPQSD